MNSKTTLIGGVLAAILLSPGLANASYVLDTGTPTSTSGPAIFNPTGWYAAEFTVSATENITSLSAYLTQNGQVGSAFTFDIYSSTNFLTTRVGSLSAIEECDGNVYRHGLEHHRRELHAGGGTYWLALQMTAVTETRGFGAGPGIAGRRIVHQQRHRIGAGLRVLSDFRDQRRLHDGGRTPDRSSDRRIPRAAAGRRLAARQWPAGFGWVDAPAPLTRLPHILPATRAAGACKSATRSAQATAGLV